MPVSPGYGPKPGGKKGGGCRNMRKGFGGVFMAAATLLANEALCSAMEPPELNEGCWWW